MAPQAATKVCNYIYAIREARLFEIERGQLEHEERR